MDPLLEDMHSGFLDELEKIGIAAKLTGLKHRVGKRPLRVSTLLKKEKEGTLLKFTREKNAKAVTLPDGSGFFIGTVGKSKKKMAEGSAGNVVPYANTDAQDSTGKPAQAPKASGEVPSREDGRDNQQIRIPGTGRNTFAPAASQDPAEHGNY